MNRRIGGIGGILFLTLTIATLALAPPPPDSKAPATELADYFRDHRTGIEWQAVVFALAALGLVAFVAAVHDRLTAGRRTDGVDAAAWVGVIALTAGWMLSYALGAGMALHSDRLSDESFELGMVAYGATASLSSIGGALLLGGYALGAHRDRSLPSWTTPVAVVGAVLHVAGLVNYLSDSAAAFSMLYVGFAALAVWILGVAIHLVRNGAEVPRAEGDLLHA